MSLLIITLELVRKSRLREEYSLLWLVGAAVVFLLSVFRKSLTALARLLGIVYAPSLLFAIGFLFTLVILISQSVVISALASKNRDLAQRLAILEWELRHHISAEPAASDSRPESGGHLSRDGEERER